MVILATSFVNFFFNPFGLQVGDSIAYAFGSEKNQQLLSFTGHSLRNWPIVLLNLVLGKSIFQVLAQTIFSAISWCFLLFTYFQSNFSRKKIFAVIATLLFMTSQNLTWNSTQLAESYSISLIILILTFTIKLVEQRTTKNLILITLTSYIWASVHGRNYTSFVIFSSVFITLLIFRIALTRSIKTLNLKVLGYGLFAITLFLHSSLVINNQSKQEYEPGLGYSALAYSYTFASQPEAAQVRSELMKVEEVRCLTLDGSADLYKLVNEMKTNCKSANTWLNENFLRWYAKFLLSHPHALIKMAMGGLLYGNQPPELYGGTLTMLPIPLESLFFGIAKYVDSHSLENNQSITMSKVNSPLLLWMAILIIYLVVQKLRPNPKFSHISVQIFLAIAICSIVSAMVAVVICPAEYFKLTIQMQILFFLTSTIVFLNSFKGKLIRNE
jgi:hypothetical protein